MDLRDFYKEHYMLEVTRRHELTNALVLPFGVLSLLVGGILVAAKEIDLPLDGLEVFQLVAIAVALLCFSVTAYFLTRSYFNYEYGYIATPKDIKDFRDGLFAHYAGSGFRTEDAIKQAEQETLEYIDSEYAKHTHRNIDNNDRKSSYLHKANGALICSVLSTVVAGIPYVVSSVVSPSEVYKVEIISPKEFKVSNQSSIQQPPVQQPTQQQQTPPNVAPPKPSPPPGRIIREGVDPTKHRSVR